MRALAVVSPLHNLPYMASIYARAFKEGFTLTLVSGRTVGIGAYLARLGRRCVSGPQAAPRAPATGHI